MSWLWFKYDPTYMKISSQTTGYCKGTFQEHVKEETTTEVKTVKEPPGLPKQKPTKTTTNITDEVVKTLKIPRYRNKSLKK